jgi:hypothetical protein
MPRFTNPDDLKRHLKKAMDAYTAEVLITVQAELGSTKVSPVDTGRLRSSWFAAESEPSNAVAAETADEPNMDARGLRVDSRKEYHLTNNLEYAQSAAVEGNVVSKPRTWFHDFRNQRIPKIQQVAAEVIRREFDL